MTRKKLTQEFLQEQIARLRVLPRGEDRPWGSGKKGEKNYEPALRDELLKALWEQSSSNEHAERIVNRVMETTQFCPVPSELIATAQEVPERIGILRDPEAGCVECGGSGWKQTVRDGYSGVEMCKCVKVPA